MDSSFIVLPFDSMFICHHWLDSHVCAFRFCFLMILIFCWVPKRTFFFLCFPFSFIGIKMMPIVFCTSSQLCVGSTSIVVAFVPYSLGLCFILQNASLSHCLPHLFLKSLFGELIFKNIYSFLKGRKLLFRLQKHV